MIDTAQPGILAEETALARYLTFRLAGGASAADVRAALETLPADADAVFGLGLSVATLLGASVPGLRAAPHLVGHGVEMPATTGDLWCWLRGDDRGELLHRGRALQRHLAPAFALEDVAEGFQYREGRDLTGYVDGTENPGADRAAEVALVAAAALDPGLQGSSFVAVQTWRHDLATFDAMGTRAQDEAIGRRISDNEELEDAPASAHVVRTAQEDFDPEAWLLRRSMPWAGGDGQGLVFIAFAASLDPFEAQARRMLGLDDGIVDALFRFTRPVTGAYYWCPPIRSRGARGALDLRALGLNEDGGP